MTNDPHLSWSNIVEARSDVALADAMWLRSETLRAHGAPVLYSLKHLAVSTGSDYGFLRGVIRRNLKAYRSIRIAKRTGGYRNLQSPIDALAKVQRWILHEILYTVPRHKNNFAYFPEVTTLDSAKRHSGASWLIKADIHDYFPSVTEKQVFNVFSNLGYSALLSFELARICTWPRSNPPVTEFGEWQRTNDLESGPVYPRSAPAFLPQGAPTSGALSNACTVSLDEDLSQFAMRERFVYTRYSDDMVISTTRKFDRHYAGCVIANLNTIVKSNGFRVHAKKTKVIPPGARKIVLGMMVCPDGVSILPEHKRMIQLYVHGVFKYGPVAYSDKREFDSVISFINHVEGWLAHLSSIDERWTRRQSEAWRMALLRHNVFVNSLK